jgi:sugar lactone lactonase YvrE/mono/diheme cytochrome c family protein
VKRIVFAGAAAAAALLVASAPSAQETAKSTWDGIYTDAQAERGAAAYAQHCQACHGAQLAGTGEAKPLAGPEFLSSWDGLSLGELFERTRATMPLDSPASLAREQYADILAYMLKFNGFPAGQAELDKRTEVLNAIRLVAFKPQAALSAADAQGDAAAGGPNDAPNPYTADTGFFRLPPGRPMGSSSGVAVDSRGHVWVADRCGANACTGSPLDPIMEFDGDGHFVQAFGKGLFNFPHGFSIDARDHIWVTDNQVRDGKGAQVFEFDRTGKLIRTLGKAGVSAEGPDTFVEPNAVAVAKDGTIFVADGHSAGRGAHRIVKLDPSGRFLKQWGTRGAGPDQLEVPHAIALDTRGRLFVADRWNNRVVVYDQDGKVLATWTQFGRPSGVFVDRNDVLYVADSESRMPDGYGHHPGWKRGVRIGSARDGRVTAFIPDTEPNPDAQATSGPEGLTVDRDGVIYGAMVFQKQVVRYAKRPR